MKEYNKISKAVIKRLPRYRRYLHELRKKGIDRISSNELSALIGYTASQIRQDFNNFGGFGQQGYGYNVQTLYDNIGVILGLNHEYNMIIVGSGNLGQALANYTHYYRSGFKVCGMFDVNPKLVGMSINDIKIMDYDDMQDYVKKNGIDIGIISTGKESAQNVADKMVEAGIKGIWNFAPMDLNVADKIALENVHLSDSLHSLAYEINKNKHLD
ncbi:MAG: redox-sensing transcriptional repressor Rex [Anaerovorax sp.]